MKTSIFTLVALMMVMVGCAPKNEPHPMPILTQPMVVEQNPAENPGSLYDPNQSEFLFEDNRARRVGDIVLVTVKETSKSKLKADTTANRNTTTNMGVTAFPSGGGLNNIPGAAALGAKPGMSIQAGAQNNFTGDGETNHESDIEATVATRIVRRLPGSLFQVEGARRIRVNNETQILVVRGLIRQRDIGADNQIPSQKLAEAQIEIYGQGVLTDKQRPGWLSRILDNIFPF